MNSPDQNNNGIFLGFNQDNKFFLPLEFLSYHFAFYGVTGSGKTRLAMKLAIEAETIYIYEEDYNKALETLRHKFIDYAVSQIIEPHRQVVNMLIAMINEDAYKRKEKLVERLRKLAENQARVAHRRRVAFR